MSGGKAQTLGGWLLVIVLVVLAGIAASLLGGLLFIQGAFTVMAVGLVGFILIQSVIFRAGNLHSKADEEGEEDATQGEHRKEDWRPWKG